MAGKDNTKDFLEDLVVSIICPTYKGKKTMEDNEKKWMHSRWENKLTMQDINYTALDAFVIYDSYRRISTMRECLRQ